MARTCDCGETFATLSALRLHQQDECTARERFGDIDPDASDTTDQMVEQLSTCRNCGTVQSGQAFEFEHSTAFVDGDFHYVCEFTCHDCGFQNENQAVLEGVDADDLDDLPADLQPDEGVNA